MATGRSAGTGAGSGGGTGGGPEVVTADGAGHLDEFAAIARLFAPLAQAPGAFGLTDDAALAPVPPPGSDTLASLDTLVEGVHYLPGDPPGDVARKLVRVNLSDLAAKGARPGWALLSCAFGPACDAGWITAFAHGLGEDLARFGLALMGGDTVRTPGPATFSLAIHGPVRAGRMLRRAGAQPGDGLYVTGTLGDAALGLAVARGDIAEVALGIRDPLVARYRVPRPRVDFGARLAGFAHAAMDISDGLFADLRHLASASGLAAVVEGARVPVSSPARRLLKRFEPHDRWRWIAAGDDYEILFAAPPDAADAIAEAAGGTDTAVTRIGRFRSGPAGEVLLAEDESEGPAPAIGFRHF